MVSEPTKKDHKDILAEAQERYSLAVSSDKKNRDDAKKDLEFLIGEQWPQDIRKQRTTDNRPCLTINQLPQFVRQVTGDLRNGKFGIKVSPVDDKSDVENAEIRGGVIRQIERQSEAPAQYLKAAEQAAQCGIGHVRVLTDYTDDDTFEQDILIKHIRNPFAVVWDPLSTETNRSDARYCFVPERVTKADHKRRFPGVSLSNFDKTEPVSQLVDWMDGDDIIVAEYWRKVPTTKTIALYSDGMRSQVIDTTDEDALAEVEQFGLEMVKERTVDTHEVQRFLINGDSVLEDNSDPYPGKHIPIIPFIGEEVSVGEKVVRSGVIRQAIGPQMLYNFMRTASAETIALSPKVPYVGTAKMFEGNEDLWGTANTANHAFLKYNVDPDAPGMKPQREAPAMANMGALQEAQLAASDMQSTTGIYNAGLGAKSNETSGKAILARQREGDVGTSHYADNAKVAVQHVGVVILDLMPHIYDTTRVLRIIGEDEVEHFKVVNNAIVKEGGEAVEFDLTQGKYDITVTAGPSYTTKRAEAVDSMMAFIQAFPPAGPILGDLLAKNMDWPGAEEIAKRLKKLLPPGIADEGDDEQVIGPDGQPIAGPKDDMQAGPGAPQGPGMPPEQQLDMANKEETLKGKQLLNAMRENQLQDESGQLEQTVKALVIQTLQEIMAGEVDPLPAPPDMPDPIFANQPANPAGFLMSGMNPSPDQTF